MIASFYDYAGPMGLISMLGWMAAWVLVLLYAAKVRKPVVARIVLALALIALVSSRYASEVVSDIEVARTPAADDPERAKAIEEMEKRAAKVRFAEDSTADRLDVAGATKSELEKAGVQVPANDNFDWRSRGKQTRDAGMSKATTPEGSEGAATQPAEEVKPPRALPEAEFYRANRLDEANLFFARLTFAMAVLLVIVDYLRRFNQTFVHVLPLPIAGPMVDSIFPKARVVHVAGKPGEPAILRFLERSLLKGESFIYLGESDPWSRQSDLPRLLVLQAKQRVDKLCCAANATPEFREHAFESAWHGHACVVVPGLDSANAMLGQTLEIIANRDRAKEPARRTVNLVWDFAEAPSDDVLAKAARTLASSNFRLIVVTPTAPAQARTLFSESYQAAQITC